ncbi:hypothetical protein INT45_013019, partial [Circinella minor]
KGTYPDPLPATTPEVSTNQHPLILIVIFLVLFQLHSVSKHLSSIIINFCIVLLQDIYPTASIPTSLATLHCVTGFSPLTDALQPHSLLLTLNVNWFGPFENSTYSCGAIYLTVNNLPLSEHFKTENVILVGVMPGPREPSASDINLYLRLMVDELLEWYNGVRVRLGLLNVACDIPAAWKVSGFTSHGSRCGCHKCHRQFPVFPGTKNLDYSGFEVDNWVLRTMDDNWEYAEQWRRAETMAGRRECERENGTRCRGFLTDTEDLQQMQVLTDGILLLPDYVSLKRKIVSGQGFSYMTADDWKSWCIVYSSVVLDGHVERRYLENWFKFADTCRLMVKPSITIDEIQEAATLIHQFCTSVENLYGPEEITPNIHLHMHLDVMIEDFGPLLVLVILFDRLKPSSRITNITSIFLIVFLISYNTVNVIHRQFDPHSFFALSTNIQQATLVTGSKPVPSDTHPLNYGREMLIPEQLHSFLLQFYNVVYSQDFVHFTQADDGQEFVSNQY